MTSTTKPSSADIEAYMARESRGQGGRSYNMSRAEIAMQLVERRGKPKKKRKKLSKTEVDVFKQEINIDDHIITLEALAERFETHLVKGLKTQQAQELLRLNGPNSLDPPKGKSHLVIFCEFMFQGFSLLLWIGAILCFVGFAVSYGMDPDTPLDQIYLGSVIVLVVLFTAGFGYYQETANMSIMNSFKNMLPKYATVIRSGVSKSINSKELVVGDLVSIEGGECVPADIRIIEANTLKVDNSSITGESDPQSKGTECTEVNPLETANLAFFGTYIVEGNGKGIVIACGNDTLMGHIAALTAGLHADQTPIKKELKKFMVMVTIFSVTCGGFFFVLGILFGRGFFESFIFMIAIVVANLPEGLLVTMTAALTLTAKKMNKKNCMCKNLHAIETLGSTTVICSDKTGTLTQNKMTVAHLFYDGTIYDVLGERHNPDTNAFNMLCRAGILCSKAQFKPGQEHVLLADKVVTGDASETAVLKCMEWMAGSTTEYRLNYPKVCEIPFNSTNKYHVSIHKKLESAGYLLVIKGAPEKIIDRCSTVETYGTELEMTSELRRTLEAAVLELGVMGERVLGFADYELPIAKYPENYEFNADVPNFPLTGLRLTGFMSMIDPPRPGVPDAVEKCKSAGIRVVMVTGDHPVTAMAIARKVGIISEGNHTSYDIALRKNMSISQLAEEDVRDCKARVIAGPELREIPQDGLDDIVMKYSELVFARTSPQQKLLIVEAFQRIGDIVAVTGDGVNDSPALKKADIGVAMGISGSDVSKEAADMIILDDNFASIVVGVEEGRLIFDNLKKSIAYMLTSNVPEMFPFVLFFLLEIPLPLSIMAILIVDVGTDLWPGISLAYEKAEADIMKRKPRNPLVDKLVTIKLLLYTNINIGIIQTLAGLTCYFYVMAEYGFLPHRLIGILDEWQSEHNDVRDSYNQQWTRHERVILERKGVSAYFMAIVVTQVADCIIVKTRRLSIVQQGMTNCVMNMGIVFEVGIAILVVYCPGLNSVLWMDSVSFTGILPAIPYALLIIIFDEGRKYFIRKDPNGWVFQETYF